MRRRPTIQNARHACSSAHFFYSCTPLRLSSTWSNLTHELKSRPLNITYDYLSPTPSHLLNISLRDFLPSSCYPKYFNASNPIPSGIGPQSSSPDRPPPLQQGHHLVYFPPPIPHNDLLPDGTDTLHSPRAPTPFTRRLWAGGSVTFSPSSASRLCLSCESAACVEGIRDVTIKGKEGDEKIFVHVERRYGIINRGRYGQPRHRDAGDFEEGLVKSIWEGDEAAVVEKRNLVFLRAREDVKMNEGFGERVVKPSHIPDFRVSLTPSPSLLFRFSALTFNAHLIHLDPSYSRGVEGHRNLLVHGPLSLVLMLSVLQSQLKEVEMITSFTYRNLAPLYAQEEMVVCIRKDREDGKKYEVWIEGKSRGYAVKGSATVGKMEES